MSAWFSANMGVILICILLVAVSSTAIGIFMRGKQPEITSNSCPGGCENCPLGNSCHKA